ncbi:MAG: VTT domain-containing protein [Candidatus Paceibacterota bacterium]
MRRFFPMFDFISHLINSVAGNPIILSLTIIVGTLFLEDAVSVIVGVLAADGHISIPLALFSLYTGVVAGDIGFYLLGWLASTHKRLSKYVDHDLVAPLRAWLETRFILAVFSARFIPGTRFATYTASGFFRSPFATFVGTAITATSVWITFLFFSSYLFGHLTSTWIGPVRWGVALIFLLVLFFVGRHNLLSYRAKRDELRDTIK